MKGTAVFVLDGIRTPIGRIGGSLAGIRPDDLAAGVLRHLAARHPELDPGDIDGVWFGNANGAGEENRNVARMASLLAGWPVGVPGMTVNRLCSSGMDALIDAARAVAVGDADLVAGGGVESMSRAPWVVTKPSRGYSTASQTLHSTTLGWRLVNPLMPAAWTVGLGEATEALTGRLGIGREAQDRFATESHHKAARAWTDGRFEAEVVAVDGVDDIRDDSIRPETSQDKLATLRPAFHAEGTITAGNASPLSDGAAVVLAGTEAAAGRIGTTPLARIAASAVVAVEPQDFGIAPVEAAERALARAGISWKDIECVELNEAFAGQALACLGAWQDLDPSLVNLNGGAIALGHPLGCSGTRLIGTLAHELARSGKQWGLAAMCVGVGQGVAVVLERAG